MSANHRSLAEAQAALVTTLTSGSTDRLLGTSGVAATARVLNDKRRRALARRFPTLARLLDKEFTQRFDEYTRSGCRATSVDEDAFQFISFLQSRDVTHRQLGRLRRRLWLRLRLARMLGV